MDTVCDICVANIISDVIISFAAPLKAHIRPGGLFICSGIARERKGEVIDALNAANYRDLEILDDGEWTAIAARKGE